MTSKTFLLGVGAPRCGTTWLFKFLSRYSQIDFGFKKEYHIFDSVHVDQFEHFSAKRIHRNENKNITVFEKKYFDELELLKSMELNHDNYFEYFSKILSNEKISIAGDITPTYCGLPVNILQLIKQNFKDRGIAIKVVFTLRDPVEKIYSEARLAIKFKSLQGKRLTEDISTMEVLKQRLKADTPKCTTEYSEIVQKLTSVFTPDELYLGLYEIMHTKTEVNRLCHFLELQPSYDLLDTKVNAAPEIAGLVLEKELRKSIALAYAKEYVFAQQLFPNYNLSALWKNTFLASSQR
ncbi:sulfotransferase domain-containing protein [Polynucleobacter asymbioticus]|jgi:hypothetical protein|uniref:Sulfotransferase domain-containing protein n=1 Tax=Polynucleobacter asymbioticus TaxID=576611 RepID=A0AAC9IU40_9BURK|nr:sulfotransferase domain-containing protein [Polynucleobacter asymbioticus]APB98209.1 hypothetical protein A4F89_02080 [Polynucleobacter asymbioticus]APC00495.1 hypothetical protein AOC25_02085 [Polynucleobacter asymbioticus]